MLIRHAEINFDTVADIRISDGSVVEIGRALNATATDSLIDARGCALLPGLHDHHLHFMSFAASLDSVRCGPPQVNNEVELVAALQKKMQSMTAQHSTHWLRAVGYHESVAGLIDRAWLDRVAPQVPVRVQHRSGRLWILNSRALALLGDLTNSPLEKNINGNPDKNIDKKNNEFTGRLYDADAWLRARIGVQLPDIKSASRHLVNFGVTGFTDTSPHNDAATFELFAELQQRGELLQDVVLMGDASLDTVTAQQNMRRGATKIHLHDNELPDFAALCRAIRASHSAQRPVAIHCVTLTELVFSVNAFIEAGVMRGDRIEHAAITPPDMLRQIAELKLIVVTQPNFISERGDRYLREVDSADRPWLYRLRGFIDAGIALAAGTDAPFGVANPWLAMQAAVTRSSRGGAVIGADEALTPEAALQLFLGDPLLPGRGNTHRIEVGSRADFCLLDRPWSLARIDLAAVAVAKTIQHGYVI